MTRRRQQLTVCYIGLTVLLTVIYYRFPTDRIIWWTGIGLSSFAAIVIGVRLNKPAHAGSWYLLAVANLSFTAGEVVQVIQTEYLHQLTFPSLADAFYLAEFVLYAAGVWGFIRWRTAHQDRGSLIDVFPGGCVVSSYDFARGPHVALVTELQRVVDLYPRRQLSQELRAELGIQLDP